MGQEESDIGNKKDLEDKLGNELNLQKELLEDKEKKLSLFQSSLSEKSTKFIQDIHESEEDTENQAREANKIINSAKIRINEFINDFTEKSRILKRNIWIIFAGFLASFFIPYFALPIIYANYTDSIPIEPALLSIAATIICFIILIYKVSRSIDSKLFKPNDEKSLGQIQNDSSSVTQDKITFSSRKEKFNQKLQEINDRIHKIISVSEEYIPGLKEYYAGMALKTKQEHFAFTLRNALRNYGLLDSTIEKKLSRYSNLAQTEEDWLDDTSNQVSTLRGISKEIIQLAYYDYTGSQSGINNVWSTIIDAGKIAELINVLKNNLELENRIDLPNQPFIELIRDTGTFSLENFMRLYHEFYNNLEKEKKTVLWVLEDLGFSIDDGKRKQINKFFPNTKETKEWTKQLIDNAAIELEQDASVVWLFYLDKMGLVETRDAHWQKEKIIPNFVDKISDFMVQSLNYPSEFERNDMKKLCSEIIHDENTFNVSKITKEFSKRIVNTKRIKSLFMYSLEAKKIQIPQKIRENQFEKMIAFENDPETEIAKKIALLLGIDKEIVTLFYFDYVQSPRERQESFDKIKNDGLYITIKDRDLTMQILETFGDEMKKDMMNCVVDKQLTIYDILKKCDIPQTSGYRKIKSLIENGFLTINGYSTSSDGKKIPRYTSVFEHVKISIEKNTVLVSIKIKKDCQQSDLLQIIQAIEY